MCVCVRLHLYNFSLSAHKNIYIYTNTVHTDVYKYIPMNMDIYICTHIGIYRDSCVIYIYMSSLNRIGITQSTCTTHQSSRKNAYKNKLWSVKFSKITLFTAPKCRQWNDRRIYRSLFARRGSVSASVGYQSNRCRGSPLGLRDSRSPEMWMHIAEI